MPTSGFLGNIWSLNPISREGKRAFAHPVNAHAIIDYFISGSTNKDQGKSQKWQLGEVTTSFTLVKQSQLI